MTRYALVTPDDQIYTTKDESRLDLSAGTRTGWRWLPIEEVTDDQSLTEQKVAEAPIQAVEPTRVLRTRVIRDKTLAELEAEASQSADSITEADEMTVAMAVATVRLVMAARDGLLAGQGEAFILGRYKAEILDVIRKRRGLS